MDEKGYIYELDVISACFILVCWSLPYLLVYKSTFYDQKISPKNQPRLLHESYTKTWPKESNK